MIKNYGVFEVSNGLYISYSDQKKYMFTPLNCYVYGYMKSGLDFTWHNIKYLAVF